MSRHPVAVVLVLVSMLMATTAIAGQPSAALPAGARVFVAEMPDGFADYLKNALQKKKVPVVVVPTREEAEFEITGSSETQKAGVAKKLFLGSWRSDEQASIKVANLASGEVVFAYSVNKKDSAHGKRSTAESCAKHLKDHIEGKM